MLNDSVTFDVQYSINLFGDRIRGKCALDILLAFHFLTKWFKIE